LEILNETRLPLEIEQSLYRIIQESFANIARHSQAKKVVINIDYRDESIHILVKDDGIGFDVEDKPSGLGLRSMRERIDLINGEMQINSNPGKGSSIKIKAPVAI
jgi:signal transduction histidine kinase